MNSEPDYTIVFDGGSRGNPGPAYGSYQIAHRDGEAYIRRLELGVATNNVAEYRTLIAALEDLTERIRQAGQDPADYTVEVKGDSRLVIRQVRGEWQVREPHLRPLCDRVRTLLSRFREARLTWHPRERSVAILNH